MYLGYHEKLVYRSTIKLCGTDIDLTTTEGVALKYKARRKQKRKKCGRI